MNGSTTRTRASRLPLFVGLAVVALTLLIVVPVAAVSGKPGRCVPRVPPGCCARKPRHSSRGPGRESNGASGAARS